MAGALKVVTEFPFGPQLANPNKPFQFRTAKPATGSGSTEHAHQERFTVSLTLHPSSERNDKVLSKAFVHAGDVVWALKDDISEPSVRAMDCVQGFADWNRINRFMSSATEGITLKRTEFYLVGVSVSDSNIADVVMTCMRIGNCPVRVFSANQTGIPKGAPLYGSPPPKEDKANRYARFHGSDLLRPEFIHTLIVTEPTSIVDGITVVNSFIGTAHDRIEEGKFGDVDVCIV